MKPLRLLAGLTIVASVAIVCWLAAPSAIQWAGHYGTFDDRYSGNSVVRRVDDAERAADGRLWSPTDGADVLIAALAAADRVIHDDPSMHRARFDRARIIDQLGLRELAIAAYETYCRIDGGSELAVEARRRLAALEGLSAVRPFAERRAELMRAARAGDRATIDSAASAVPQEARTLALSELLPAWGEAVARDASGEANATLMLARMIGDALAQGSGDTMVRDAVHAIDAASTRPEVYRRLASAHSIYGQATELYRARRIGEAAPLYEEARSQFESTRSPSVFWAAFYRASAAVDIGAREEALDRLDALETAGKRYPALGAHLHRLRGTIFAFDGFIGDALVSYRKAYESFSARGEIANAVDVSARIAAALAELGRPGESWVMHRDSIARAGALKNPRLIQLALYSAMYVAIEEERWDLAHALVNLLAAVDDANPRIHADAITWRALTARQAGMERLAHVYLDAAREAVRSIPDPAFRESGENDLRLVEAMLVESSSPETAAALLTEYLEVTQEHERLTRVPRILTLRARMFRGLGREAEAESDLRRAVTLVDGRTIRVRDDLLRDTFLGRAGSAHVQLADLLDARGEYREAIELLDRSRAAIFLENRAASWPLLDPTTAIVSFAAYEDRNVTYVIRAGAIARFAQGNDRQVITQLADRFADAVRNDDDATFRKEGQKLYDSLLGAAMPRLAGVRKLVIVADAPLDRLPYAALAQPTGRFLLETFVIAIAPAVHVPGAKRADAEAGGAFVAIGNPRFDRARHPSLAPLAGAEDEARRAAAMYAEATVLLADEATRERTTRALKNARVAHFGTHAVADPASPGRSRILLAHGDELLASDIARMKLPEALDTVVLAGCRTASAKVAYGFVQNLTAAFQSAGVRRVVGSLWDVDDTKARDVSLAFHRALSRGVPPDQALRDAQLPGIDGPPSAWASFQLYEVQ